MNGRASVAVVALALVLAGLSARFAVRTLQTARHGDARDFATLYTGAHLFRDGVSFYDPEMKLEDGVNRNAALVTQARRLGTLHRHEDLEHIHAFSYPPFAVLPALPFTLLSWRHAVEAWLALSVLFAAAAFGWTVRAARLSAVPAMVLAVVFLMGEPFENSIGLGQINQFVLALLALFFWAFVSGRPLCAGVALGVATALRFHPALFIGWLAWRRQWRACGAAVIVAAVCTALATVTVGWTATVTYVTAVAPKYATASSSLGNASLTGWVMATGHGLLPAVPLDAWRAVGVVASVALLAASAWRLLPPGPAPAARVPAELAFVALVLLLVTPNTTINHLVFTLLPLAVLIDATLRDGSPGRAAWLALALVLIGSIDDYYQHPGLAAGPAVLLAGIKTYGLVILTVMAAGVLRRPAAAA